MRITTLAATLIAAGVVAGCGTIEDSAWTNGVSREEAMDVSRAVQAQKHAHQIYRYERDPDGSIIVSTDVGDFSARRIGGRWEFRIVVITS